MTTTFFVAKNNRQLLRTLESAAVLRWEREAVPLGETAPYVSLDTGISFHRDEIRKREALAAFCVLTGDPDPLVLSEHTWEGQLTIDLHADREGAE